MQKNNLAFIASVFIAIAILLGAWNAHGMEDLVIHKSISEKYLKTFYTGVQYQFFNSLGLLILSFISDRHKFMKTGIWFIGTGMFIFSFSLYILSFHEIIGSGFRILGAITPVGGLLMACGWILAAFSFLKKNNA
ncbi:MAG: DUF423 domain-containing protein [Bacteroidetes bacterium]|nr:DUF423 domain-containing protein [Bacteroidota bacterium]